MRAEKERRFLANVLKVNYEGTNGDRQTAISGLGQHFDIYRQPNEQHYAAHHTDILMPAASANPQQTFPAMVYADGTSAAVAYQGKDYRTFVMGFPFECIADEEMRSKLMYGIMKFLIP